MDAIYARQSIDKKGSLSIEGQIELCRKFTVDDALIFSDKLRASRGFHRCNIFELRGKTRLFYHWLFALFFFFRKQHLALLFSGELPTSKINRFRPSLTR